MTLTVEDGTIIANADSYVDHDFYKVYAKDRGWTLQGTTVDEANLRRAYDVLNTQYNYVGKQVDRRAQTGAFPRYADDLDSDEIPREIQNAQCEQAYLIQTGNDPFAIADTSVTKKMVKAGPLETETTYDGGQSQTRFLSVEGYLKPFLSSGLGQTRMVRA